jgi:two-component system, sensor histidine kinase PdtaS
MSIPNVTTENERQRTNRRLAVRKTRVWKAYSATKAELTAALAREDEFRREKSELLQHQDVLAQEFEHRLVNSLQSVVSLLSLQSRVARTVEAASQLINAARRVGAAGRVHRRLHLLDHQKNVEFKQYLQDLCDDLSGLLLPEGSGRTAVVAATSVKLSTSLAIPLGFIVSELMTNSSKYATGNITVRMERSAAAYLLSVSDGGPGLPAEFAPAASGGLGMKIIQALVKEIGGTLLFAPGDGGHGTRITVAFEVQPQAEPWTSGQNLR